MISGSKSARTVWNSPWQLSGYWGYPLSTYCSNPDLWQRQRERTTEQREKKRMSRKRSEKEDKGVTIILLWASRWMILLISCAVSILLLPLRATVKGNNMLQYDWGLSVCHTSTLPLYHDWQPCLHGHKMRSNYSALLSLHRTVSLKRADKVTCTIQIKPSIKNVMTSNNLSKYIFTSTEHYLHLHLFLTLSHKNEITEERHHNMSMCLRQTIWWRNGDSSLKWCRCNKELFSINL